MGRFFMGQELIQGELPANSPKPPSTPPEGVIMTDVAADGYTKEYIYIAGNGPAEEIVISEGYPAKKRVSGAAVAVEEAPEFEMGAAAEPPVGILMPEGAILPEGAVFSGLPNPNAPSPSMGRRSVGATPVVAGVPVSPSGVPLAGPVGGVPVMAGGIPVSGAPVAGAPVMGGPVQVRQAVAPPVHSSFPTSVEVPPPMAVPTMTIQKAAPKPPVVVQQQQAPTPGVEVVVPFVQKPVDQAPEITGNVRLTNSIEMLKPVNAQPVAEGPRMSAAERPVTMLGQVTRPLPLTTQEKKSDAYPVSNPIAAPQVGMQISSPAHGQNQVPLRQLGQAAPAAPAPAPAAPTSTTGKCPGAVEMPDGRTIEPEDKVSLKDLCELMPFLVETLTNLQSKGLAPGQQVPVKGQQANGQTAVPTSASFGPAGQGPYGRAGGGMGFGFAGGGGGAPGPTGPQGPVGQMGASGPGSITEPPVVKVDGDFVAGAGAFVPVPGTTVPFTMSAPGVAEVKVLVTLGTGPTQQAENCQLGVRINGTDYPLTVRLLHTFAANVGEFDLGQCFLFPIQLPAGAYTADLLLRGLLPGEFGGGTGASAAVNANPSIPLIITVSHN